MSVGRIFENSHSKHPENVLDIIETWYNGTGVKGNCTAPLKQSEPQAVWESVGECGVRTLPV